MKNSLNTCTIKIDKINPKGVDDFLRLSRIEYGNKNAVTDADHINWKHLNTANGASTAINLYCNGEVVGRVLLQPSSIYIDGKKIPIAFATDSLVHPEFRRPLSNFFSIMKEIKKITEFAIVLHTSNENTEEIYRNILKFKNPIMLSSYGFPVDLRHLSKKFLYFGAPVCQLINLPFRWILAALHFLSGISSRLRITTNAPDSQVFNDLLLENAGSNNIGIPRNTRFLDWRFTNTPLWKAKILHIYRESDYMGYVVLRNIELEGLKFTAVMDFSLIKNISKKQMLFIRTYIIKQAIIYGDDAVYTLLNNDAKEAKKFLGFPFLPIPDKFLPHKTPFFVHVNDEKYIAMEECSDLHITLGDLDYF